ncbi:MAG TPA: hypothetical protein VEH08_00855 [Methanomassiliicoccales archaeon]|nr:hypothetical protein [Methanomassiliicoccales archaeon]
MLAAFAALLILAVIATGLILTPKPDSLGTYDLNTPDRPTFVGKPAVVLGNSSHTGIIANRLAFSTDALTVIRDLKCLNSTGFVGTLFVDGNWARDVPVDDLADALEPFVMQGTPIAFVNMTQQIIDAIGAIHGGHFSGAHVYADGVPQNMSGFWLRPSDGFTSSLTLGVGGPADFFNGITDLYEWGAMRA